MIVVSAKRKTAIAKAYIREGKGRIRINSLPLEFYGPLLARIRIMEPVILAGDEYVSRVDIDVRVRGGGFMGQADAARTAIAKALVAYFDDEKLKNLFISYDPWLLKSDIRRKEQRKSPTSKARKHYQTSYR